MVVAVGLALSYVGGTLLSQQRATVIDPLASRIADALMPRVVHMSGVRTGVRRLQAGLSLAIHARQEGLEFDRARLAAWRDELASELRRYEEAVQGEEDIPAFRRFVERHAAFLTALDAALAEVDAGELGAARRLALGPLFRAADDLDGLALSIVQEDAQRAAALGAEIQHRRARGRDFAIALDAVASVLAALLFLLALRATRAFGRLQEASLREERARAEELDHFAGRVAHDLKGPLATIALRLDLARRSAKDPGTGAALEKTREHIGRMARMLDDLLEFARSGARPDAGARAEIARVVDEVVAEASPEAETAGVRIEVESIDPRCAAACSHGALSSVVSNLVRNGIKYGSGGGGCVRVRAFGRAGRVRLEVEDPGPGVPEGAERLIFEPYVRVETAGKDGVGLGLATVKRIVEGYGGAVGVASGGGSCFWVELPRAKPAPDHAPEGTSESAAAG